MADDDLEAGKMLIEPSRPIVWVICYHMQQCVEKCLKAFLIFNGREYPRTHNIAALLELCAEVDGSFYELKALGLRDLTKYATTVRYGEEPYDPALEEAKKAIEIAEQVRNFVNGKLRILGLSR